MTGVNLFLHCDMPSPISLLSKFWIFEKIFFFGETEMGGTYMVIHSRLDRV